MAYTTVKTVCSLDMFSPPQETPLDLCFLSVRPHILQASLCAHDCQMNHVHFHALSSLYHDHNFLSLSVHNNAQQITRHTKISN